MLIYTDDSDINNKIEATTVIIQHHVMLKSFLNTFDCHTIYSEKLQEINLVFNFAITKMLKRQLTFNEIVIFIDNQTIIFSCANSTNQSKQILFKKIIAKIDLLKNEKIEIRL